MTAIRSRSARVAAALAALAVVEVAGGCGAVPEAGGAGAAAGTEAVFGWFAPAGVPNPVEALDSAGIRLPPDARVLHTATSQIDDRTIGYLFVFEVDRGVALATCDQEGLEGARRVPAIPPKARSSMGDVSVTAGSLWCEGPAPQDRSWSRYVLIDQGSPATVHLSVLHAVS